MKNKLKLIPYSPTQEILNTSLVNRAITECLENNDLDGALEVIEIYLDTLKKVISTPS